MACHSARMFAAGDRNQVLHRAMGDKALQEGKPMKHAVEAIRQRPVMDRVERNREIQLIENKETNRYGQPLLADLKVMFPSMHDVSTICEYRTHFFPVFFDYNRELCVWDSEKTRGEISREPSMFVTLLALLSMECVINRHLAERSVLVVCYLNRVVVDLEAFLEKYLARMCAFWHRKIFATSDGCDYDYGVLKRIINLRVVGPLNARGKTADVVFIVGMQRQGTDVDFAGFGSDLQLLQIHFTRVRRRLYGLFHDLTEGIRYVDSKEELSQRAFQAGVPVSKRLAPGEITRTDRPRVHRSNLRRQLFFYELKKMSKLKWYMDYGIDFEVAGSSTSGKDDCFVSLKQSLPFQQSKVYGRQLKRDLHDVARHLGPFLKYFDDDQWLDEPLRNAFTCYQEMDNDPASWPLPSLGEELCTQENMDSIGFWEDVLHQDSQCQAKMIPDRRRWKGAHTFRTSAQRDGESEEEEDPEPAPVALFDAWKPLMLFCPTVSVDSDEKCTVSVPFSTVATVRVSEIYSKRGDPVKHVASATWLARALAEETDQLFKDLGSHYFFCCEWRRYPSS